MSRRTATPRPACMAGYMFDAQHRASCKLSLAEAREKGQVVPWLVSLFFLEHGCGSILHHQGAPYFSLCFHLPGLHFGSF